MQPFNAKVEFQFEAESIESAGAKLRRLAMAARAVGFELVEGRVEPSPPAPDDDGSPTSYGPLDETSP